MNNRYFSANSFSILCAVLSIISCISVLVFGSYTRRTLVPGQITMSDGSYLLHPIQRGRLANIFVKVGDNVKIGQKLAEVDFDHGAEGATSIGKAINIKLNEQIYFLERKEKASLNKSLINEDDLKFQRKESICLLKLLKNSEEEQKNKVLYIKRTAFIFNKLSNEHLMALSTANQQYAQLWSEIQNITNIQRQIIQQYTTIKRIDNQIRENIEQSYVEQAELERQISNLKQQIEQNESQIEYTLYSGFSGKVSALGFKPGEWVENSDVILSITNSKTEKEAEMYVPSKSIGFVKTNDHVEIQLDSFPSQKFGNIGGTVSSISQTSLPPSAISHAPPFVANEKQEVFIIKAKIEKQSFYASGRRELQEGMLFQAYILSEKRRLYQWAIDPLLEIWSRDNAQKSTN